MASAGVEVVAVDEATGWEHCVVGRRVVGLGCWRADGCVSPSGSLNVGTKNIMKSEGVIWVLSKMIVASEYRCIYLV